MAKTLSERIAERAREAKKPGRGGKNRAAFLAHRDEISKALADGWSARAVWETLKEEGKIDFSYDPFTKYVKQLIEQSQSPVIAAPIRSTASQTLPTPVEPAAPPASKAAPVSQATTNVTDSADRRHERRPQEAGFRITQTKREDII